MKNPLDPALVPALLAWFAAHARKLPWRERISPYAVWVSEIMLQQTRVDTVIGYYQRFMRELPDVAALARADDETILKLWEGLGYYRRVRNLREGARAVMREYAGVMPDGVGELRKLPGIGDYTAGAIASIAFGKPEPAVDGNVLRVLARVTGDDRDITDKKVRDDFAGALRKRYPAGREGDFTESLMELGALVCVPNGAPHCAECPVAEYCRARIDKRTGELPVKSAKTPPVEEKRTVLILHCGTAFALRRRPDSGLLAGLWEIPSWSAGEAPDAAALNRLPEFAVARLAAVAEAGEAVHRFTHRIWRMRGYSAEVDVQLPGFRWTTREELRDELALPTAFKKFATLL